MMHLRRLLKHNNPVCPTTTAVTTDTTVLEINIISAQNLKLAGKSLNMGTYVVAYLDPSQKLASRIDASGSFNPTWNDKLIFCIDGGLLSSRPYVCMVFEIYRARGLFKKDKKMGVVHVLVENLIPKDCGGKKCMAFNVVSTLEKPQAILNVGVVRLDGTLDQSFNFLDSYKSIGYCS